MKLKLHKDIQTGGWHSSLMTTYSVDPVFYDTYIERFLRRDGCDNNILLADAAMLTCALQENPAGFRRAGQRYAVVPVSVRGCFHPKIHLRLGQSKARLIIGSANATSAGWCRNLEILGEFDWHLEGSGLKTGPLIRKAYDYCTHWFQRSSSAVIDYKVQQHWQGSPWLRDLQANDEAIELSDGTAVDVLCERGGTTPSLLEQFRARLRGERVRRLIVLSPYWDADLSGLRELRDAFSGCPTIIVLHPEKSTFPIHELKESDDVKFVELRARVESQRFPHCKLFIAETAKADHVLYGSANCSDDALGLLKKAARNAEASVYRRVKPGTIRAELQLEIGAELPRTKILPLVKNSSSAANVVPSFHLSHMELVGNELFWFPEAKVNATNSQILLGDIALPCSEKAAGRWGAVLTTNRSKLGSPIVARVRLASGLESSPVIVHEEAALRRAAPGKTNRDLQAAIDRILEDEAEIIDLVPHLRHIFAPEVIAPPGHSGGSPQKEKVPKPKHDVEYSTAAEFRRALTVQPGDGRSGRFSFNDAGLVQVLGLVMKGISSFGPASSEDEVDDDNDQDLLEGDIEDDAPQDDDQSDPSVQLDGKRKRVVRHAFTEEEIRSRRQKVLKAIEAFDDLLADLSAGRGKISTKLAGQSTFMIRLMMWACTFEHRREEAPGVRIMYRNLRHHSERDSSFVFWAARIMRTLWTGKNPLARRIAIDHRQESLADDMVAWIVLSRWAIARAELATREVTDILANEIRRIAPEVFAATRELGQVDPTAEELQMRDLDRSFGCTQHETESLLAHVRSIAMRERDVRLKRTDPPRP